MDELEKKVVSFFLAADSMNKLDKIREKQRRNRSLQIAFLIDEAFAVMFPNNGDAPAASYEDIEEPS